MKSKIWLQNTTNQEKAADTAHAHPHKTQNVTRLTLAKGHGPQGYYALKPSRQISTKGRGEPHTIHQVTMAHNAENSIARAHLKEGEKMNKKSKWRSRAWQAPAHTHTHTHTAVSWDKSQAPGSCSVLFTEPCSRAHRNATAQL